MLQILTHIKENNLIGTTRKQTTNGNSDHSTQRTVRELVNESGSSLNKGSPRYRDIGGF